MCLSCRASHYDIVEHHSTEPEEPGTSTEYVMEELINYEISPENKMYNRN